MIRAYVGSGGKTTKINEDALKYVKAGYKVLVLTSTHMYREEDTIVGNKAKPIIEALQTKHYAMAGRAYKDQYIQSLTKDVYDEVCQYADIVLIEADGSRRKPLKLCRDGEPVIYDNVTEIVVIIGLSALGKKAKDVCHRLELVKEFLNIHDETIISTKHIEKLLWDGYIEPLKIKYPDKIIIPCPYQRDTLYQKVIAQMLIERKNVDLIDDNWNVSLPQLIICGGGHIAYELARIASYLEYKICIIDDREEFANSNRFSFVDQVVCDSFSHLKQYLVPNAYYVIMTSRHQDDYKCVETILQSSYAYLGMIGSYKEVHTTLEKLRYQGYDERLIASIHAPIGLDIHASTPSEIAIGILAEIIQEKNLKSQLSLSQELLATRKKGTLCIIIDKKGSSPRGVGSMMLVSDDEVIDNIGSGKIEDEVIQYAKTITNIEIKTFHLDNQTEAHLDMTCDNENTILFIPIS